MKKKTWLASACVLACGISSGKLSAAILLNDTFDSYTNGNLVGQGAWAQTGASVTTPVQVTGASDKVASVGSSGQDVYEPFSSSNQILHTDGASAETSLTINVATAQAAGDYFSHLGDIVGTTFNFYQRFFIKSATGGYVLGIAGSSGGTPTYGTTVLPLATDEAVDITWNFIPGALNDTFDILVNGTSYLAAAPWAATGAEPTQLIEANLRQGTATNAPTLTVNNLEVQGIASPVPEPASLGLLATGSSVLLGRRSRRAK